LKTNLKNNQINHRNLTEDKTVTLNPVSITVKEIKSDKKTPQIMQRILQNQA
jgi:hypothetical protein